MDAYAAQNGGIPISTHAPLAGRDVTFEIVKRQRVISTHAPLAGRDRRISFWARRITIFQPTRPLRGATFSLLEFVPLYDISTHAPLAGRDWRSSNPKLRRIYFNPRAPCGARLVRNNHSTSCIQFQPTRPLRGATAKVYKSLCTFFAITDKFQMLLHRMPPVRAFCSFLMQENHADFGCEPPK